MAVSRRRGKWVAELRDAKGVRRRITCKTKREAEARLHEARSQIAAGTYQPPREALTFSELASAYDDGHIAVALRPKTASDYRATIRLHLAPHFGHIKVREITVAAVEHFRAQLVAKLAKEQAERIGKRTGLSVDERAARTATAGHRQVNKALTLLGMMLSFAEARGWVASNPCQHVRKLRSAPQRVEPLTPAEVQQLLAVAQDPWKPLIS